MLPFLTCTFIPFLENHTKMDSAYLQSIERDTGTTCPKVATCWPSVSTKTSYLPWQMNNKEKIEKKLRKSEK